MDDNEIKKQKQREANQRYIKSIPDYYKNYYNRLKADPQQMQKRKENNKIYYDKHRDEILAKMKARYYENKDVDIFQFSDSDVLDL
jgi:hypothetical protein